MSAPMRLTPTQLIEVSQALEVLTELRAEQSVEIGDGSGRMSIRHIAADVSLGITWSKDDETFVIDDWIES